MTHPLVLFNMFFYFSCPMNARIQANALQNYHPHPRFELLFERKMQNFLLNSLQIGNIALHLQPK